MTKIPTLGIKSTTKYNYLSKNNNNKTNSHCPKWRKPKSLIMHRSRNSTKVTEMQSKIFYNTTKLRKFTYAGVYKIFI